MHACLSEFVFGLLVVMGNFEKLVTVQFLTLILLVFSAEQL